MSPIEPTRGRCLRNVTDGDHRKRRVTNHSERVVSLDHVMHLLARCMLLTSIPTHAPPGVLLPRTYAAGRAPSAPTGPNWP